MEMPNYVVVGKDIPNANPEITHSGRVEFYEMFDTLEEAEAYIKEHESEDKEMFIWGPRIKREEKEND